MSEEVKIKLIIKTIAKYIGIVVATGFLVSFQYHLLVLKSRNTLEYKPVNPSERRVGMAYGVWMDAEHWENTWGTPLLGKYDSRDRSVILKHAEWLTDAGVDFICFDWSNQIDYDPDKIWNGGKQDLIEDATAILFD